MARMTACAGYVPFSPVTAHTAPSAVSTDTARSRAHRTFRRFSSRSSALVMSKALSDTGNTRFPRSTFSGTPSASKNAMVSRGVNRVSAPYKNRPLPGMLASSVSRSQSLVTLHRPLPVIFTFLPSRSLGSSSVTAAPCRAAVMAAIRPAAPPPTPPAGRMQPIQPKEYISMPTAIRTYSLTGLSTMSGLMGFITKGVIRGLPPQRRRRPDAEPGPPAFCRGAAYLCRSLSAAKVVKISPWYTLRSSNLFSSIASSCSLRTRPQLRP